MQIDLDPLLHLIIIFCGERGIRTPGSVTFNGFQDRRNRPLCHLSMVEFLKAGGKGNTLFPIVQILENFQMRSFLLYGMSDRGCGSFEFNAYICTYQIRTLMVIQRWQSLFLFLAAVVMAFSCVTPFAFQPFGEEILRFSPCQVADLLALLIITALFLAVSIFLFKNLSRQKLVVRVSILLQIIVVARIYLFTIVQNADARVDWRGSVLLALCSFLLTLAAYRRILKDEKLLKSYDRLR